MTAGPSKKSHFSRSNGFHHVDQYLAVGQEAGASDIRPTRNVNRATSSKKLDFAHRDDNRRQLRAVPAELVARGLANAASSNVTDAATTRRKPTTKSGASK